MPRLIAAFAYRYEPDWMVDQLRENLSWVDGFAELDTRDRTDGWMPRAEQTQALRDLALEMEADWVLHVDPDERFEDGAGDKVRALLDGTADRYSFVLRELWTPTHYRSDGVWGRKRVRRLYRAGCWRAPITDTAITVYHLKMIEPANRAERARVHAAYNTWDNPARGFDYLTDERGLTLAEAGPYSPAYRPYDWRVPEARECPPPHADGSDGT